MKIPTYALSFLGAAALGTFSVPAFADTATSQTGTQSAVINGDNNQVIQVINQVNIDHPGLGRGRTNNDSRATVQDSYQGVAIDGSGNTVSQESTQANITQESSNPGRRNGQAAENPGRRNGHNKH